MKQSPTLAIILSHGFCNFEGIPVYSILAPYHPNINFDFFTLTVFTNIAQF